MTRNIMTLATVAMLSLSAAVPAVAMENEHNMLVGAVFNQVKRLDLDTTNIDKLTLGEIAEIRSVLSGDSMSEAQQKVFVKSVLDDAADR
ncbi:MAG: hypothetical protein AAF222_09635 [Pseudomonadota bacterium]